jgi:hypothetical protein
VKAAAVAVAGADLGVADALFAMTALVSIAANSRLFLRAY